MLLWASVLKLAEAGWVMQAFELVVRPALDSPGAALDRLKMTIYTTFAELGLPCPVTGHARVITHVDDSQQRADAS